MHNNQQGFFHSQCPDLSFAGSTAHVATPSLLPTSLMPAQQTPFNLGLDLKLPTPSFSGFNQATFTTTSAITEGAQIKAISDVTIPSHTSMGFVTGTIRSFAKDYIPKEVKPAGMLISAATAGKKLSERIQDSSDNGMPAAEAYTCETARTLAEELTGKLIKGSIVGGIPPYLAAAATNPALALSVPLVLPAIPDAYKGAQIAAEIVGNTANHACHAAFDLAKELSQGPKP